MLKKTKRFIGKSLQPARPVRHLSSTQAIALNLQTELPSNTEVWLPSKVDWLPEMTEVKVLTQTVVPCQPKQHESEAKKERIKYSRDFLLKLSSVSLSQKKPEFLPDHPVVLEKPEKSNPFVDMCEK
ncbi:PREDICTED: uncharacterized protein C8orf88 homolog [Merops nubicus]|uniref:uncharacterized protein C8orf88 homolog n=1 Tax=Merops nubicus TaxID=57421 RepID=UPI0004F06F33|nr:PREDICTED: uncharacterized protein C8orf88 homolog [Merops nubicus]